MKYISKLFVTFSFAGKERDETRSDFIEKTVAEIKDKALDCKADIVEISGDLFGTDITWFQRILKINPISMERTKGNKYSTTFVISANKLLNNSPVKSPDDRASTESTANSPAE